MTGPAVNNRIEGGSQSGIIGAAIVKADSITFISNYGPAAPEPQIGPDDIAACPYPGLAYFGPDDADRFFGRDETISKLVTAVLRQSLTALVGASGSGKSSVVLAGLAPRLRRGGGWLFSYFRIGHELDYDPFLALARALVPFYVASNDETERLRQTRMLADDLRSGTLTPRDVFATCRNQNKGGRILLIADQFEEAFTLVGDEAVRNHFIDVLLAGFTDPVSGGNPEICLMLTMRADFYDRALQYRPLSDALQGHVENLGPMKREELQVAIVRPAEWAGVSFEPGLVETLLDEVESKPGSLPLLQFALREMWGRQDKKRITRESYDAIGGVQGALARRAETIFAELTENRTNAQMEKYFQRLFTRLVTLGEGQQDTRRLADRSELGDEEWLLAQRLAGENNRLVVTNAPARSHETAEVVHEALIRHWPRLTDWIDRDRAFLSWLRQINANVKLWSAEPTDEGPLLRGGMLAQAVDWFANRRSDLSPDEQRYIEASVALRRRAEEEKEAARQRELRRARIARVFGFAASCITVIAVIASIGLVEASKEANERSEAAYVAALDAARQTARAEASEARMENDNTQYFEAASAALAGLTNPLSVDTDPSQIAPWAELGRATVDGFLVPPLQHQGEVNAAVFDAAGGRVITASWDNAARIWDARTGEPIGNPLRHLRGVLAATFDPKGEHVATASADGTVQIWEARTGEPIGKPMHLGGVEGMAFDPTGERLAIVWLGGARIWDARTGEPISQGVNLGAVTSAVLDAKAERIIVATLDNIARIWDLRTRTPVGQTLQHQGLIRAMAFDAQGERVVTASQDNTARVWDAHTGAPIGPPLQHQGLVTAVAFDPTGEHVVTASWDATARIWDAHTGAPIGQMLHHQSGVLAVAFDAQGERIVTASWDATARIWDAHTGTQIGQALRHQGPVKAVAFDPTGERVVTASVDQTARIWDVRPRTPNAPPLKRHGEVYTAAFDATGERIVTASADHTACIWDARTGAPIGHPMEHQGRVFAATFDATGERVVTVSEGGMAQIWYVRTQEPIGPPLQPQGSIGFVAFDETRRRILTMSGDTARIWDTHTGTPIGPPLQHQGKVDAAAFNPTGERIVTVSADHTIQIWDAGTGFPIGRSLQYQYENTINMVALDGRGARILGVSMDRAFIWDAQTGSLIGQPWQFGASLFAANFDAAGERVITASGGRTAHIWDVRTGSAIGEPMQHGNTVYVATFDPAGERVLTASLDNTARIWDARTGTPIGKPMYHQGPVLAASFDAKGERVVTASADQTAQIWTTLTGQALLDQIRLTLGKRAPEPLKIPHQTSRPEDFMSAVARGLSTIWNQVAALPRSD